MNQDHIPSWARYFDRTEGQEGKGFEPSHLYIPKYGEVTARYTGWSQIHNKREEKRES